MKDHLLSLVRGCRTPLEGRNLAREYLQARVLASLQRKAAMVSLACLGGTALRFLHGLSRYSEDLDFSLERPEAAHDFRGWLTAIRAEFQAEGYSVEVRVNDRRTVHSAFVRVAGLLHELGLSGQRSEVLAVKLEVDTRPPPGATLETTVVRRHVLLRLQHHDRASLLAGKLHCILQRPWTKGRDWYDLLWYLSSKDWPEPNLALLNAALGQSAWTGGQLTAKNWRGKVLRRLAGVDWAAVVADVEPFLEPEAGLDLLSRQTLSRLLGPRRS